MRQKNRNGVRNRAQGLGVRGNFTNYFIEAGSVPFQYLLV